jgi:hypothetical protein
MDSGAETQDAVHRVVVANHEQVVWPRSQLANQLDGVQDARARRFRTQRPSRLIGDDLINCRMISRNVRDSALTNDSDMSLGVPQLEIGKEWGQQDKIAEVRQADGQDTVGFTAIQFPAANAGDSARRP